MSPRPAGKLPFSHTFVVWASRPERGGLTLGEKVVWYHSWALDQDGPDGCYASDRSIADRLGLQERTVQQLRYRLRKLGLLASFERSEGDNPGWVAVLPEKCRPSSPRAAGAEAFALAKLLDAWLLERDPDRNPHCTSGATPIARQPMAAAAALASRAATPSSSVRGETPLHPAVNSKKDGVGAKAPTARKDDEQLAFPQTNLHVVAGGMPECKPGLSGFREWLDQAAPPRYRAGGESA